MPRTKAANKPGTERYRDERRTAATPRMHGGTWHDHDEPRDLEPASEPASTAITEGESGGDRAGTGRSRKTSGTQGRERRKRATPPSKGRGERPGAGKHVATKSPRKSGGRA